MHIEPSAECKDTYTGNLCSEDYQCGLIHHPRCKNEDINYGCENVNCSFKHGEMMPNKQAVNKYFETMEDYNKIKFTKNRKPCKFNPCMNEKCTFVH